MRIVFPRAEADYSSSLLAARLTLISSTMKTKVKESKTIAPRVLFAEIRYTKTDIYGNMYHAIRLLDGATGKPLVKSNSLEWGGTSMGEQHAREMANIAIPDLGERFPAEEWPSGKMSPAYLAVRAGALKVICINSFDWKRKEVKDWLSF